MTKLMLYMARWQCSSPVLFLVIVVLQDYSPLTQTIVANLVGSLMFFPVDKLIFKKKNDAPMGVSQWKAHGEKYGYWDYFEKQINGK